MWGFFMRAKMRFGVVLPTMHVSRDRPIPWEAFFWLAALVALFVYDGHTQSHVSLCPFRAMGFSFCPGCGLGRSISLALHGELLLSFRMHPFGILAVVVLTARIIKLLKTYLYGQSPGRTS
jgi:hypothetical protein